MASRGDAVFDQFSNLADAERRQLLDALQEADERFRTMADNSPVLIWQTDTAGGGYVNRYYLEFFGVTMESLAEMKWTQLLHPDDLAGYLDAYQSAFGRQERYEHVCRFRRADGEYRWLHNIGVPHHGRDGALTGFIGCSFDVTDRFIAEEQLRAANKVKDRFLSIAAHDLRTPMTGILGWTKILRTAVDDETRNEALHWIEQSVNAQARLIEDLLDSTRIREGKFALNRETLDLEPIVAAAFTTVAAIAAERGVELLPPETTKAIVFGDPARLQQVIWNLLSNAIKFTHAGKKVRTFLRTDDTTATVIVEDEGDGIDGGFLPHIFQPFEQDEKGERSGGLGLGLYIVSTIVQMHSGTIDAQSDGPGKGARFVFRIPLV